MKKIVFFLLLGFAATALSAQDYVSFTLRNQTLKSIPLKIPGVMNPNLSPMSNSGVSLKVGQKIYFFNKRKKYLLLEVSKEEAGQTIIVNELIRRRKKELEL
jgi:predicted cation transporter